MIEAKPELCPACGRPDCQGSAAWVWTGTAWVAHQEYDPAVHGVAVDPIPKTDAELIAERAGIMDERDRLRKMLDQLDQDYRRVAAEIDYRRRTSSVGVGS